MPAWARRIYQETSPFQREISALERRLNAETLNLQKTHEKITDIVRSSRGDYVGRPGGTESVGLRHFLSKRLSPRARDYRKPYPRFFRLNAERYSGIPSTSQRDWDYFQYLYLQAALTCSVFGYGLFAPDSLGIARLRQEIGMDVANIWNLEPWSALANGVTPWTAALADKRVLVVHPFVNTIHMQFQNRENIDGVSEIIPKFELSTVKPPITVNGSSPAKVPWGEHFETLRDEVLAHVFDVVLIAAGSYGLPLAHAVAEAGKPAVHLGGSLQLLFGIVGRRWNSDPLVAGYFQGGWTGVDQSDVYPGLDGIEGGSYS